MITSALHRAADWAKSVFSSAALGDPRRTARLVNVAAQLAKYSGKSITISSEGSEAMQEGAYRFIRNPNVSAEAIRKAGAMQTVKLAQEFPELLAIEDTTSLSYRHQVAEEDQVDHLPELDRERLSHLAHVERLGDLGIGEASPRVLCSVLGPSLQEGH